ncbi:hypothetical protein CHU98_g1669 [Xylaria longipes]|nr:hypothetical protein CHU98_g1669 [Xylaria longipes]
MLSIGLGPANELDRVTTGKLGHDSRDVSIIFGPKIECELVLDTAETHPDDVFKISLVQDKRDDESRFYQGLDHASMGSRTM